jgi:NAD-dependent DNA ligase
MLDPHGQPYNVRFNRARRAERDLSELLGLAKGLLGDGVVTSEEAVLVAQWICNHPAAAEQWPVNALSERLQRIFADGHVDEAERLELAEVLSALVGGTAGVILGEDAATELPVDIPCPTFAWSGSVFVFTGKFAFGTRVDCQREVARLGAFCDDTITMRTNYLIIGTFGSRDWVHTSFGRKIQKAVDYRSQGHRLAIVAEDHWAAALPSQV